MENFEKNDLPRGAEEEKSGKELREKKIKVQDLDEGDRTFSKEEMKRMIDSSEG